MSGQYRIAARCANEEDISVCGLFEDIHRFGFQYDAADNRDTWMVRCNESFAAQGQPWTMSHACSALRPPKSDGMGGIEPAGLFLTLTDSSLADGISRLSRGSGHKKYLKDEKLHVPTLPIVVDTSGSALICY